MMDRDSILLNTQLRAGLRGDFQTGKEIAMALSVYTPNCPRANFNRGWYELMDGNLQVGHRLMDYGRHVNSYGNRHIGTDKPIWNRQRTVRVLLNTEGGLGDQIHGVRFAKILNEEYNCSVVVSCSEELIDTFKTVKGISKVVSHDEALKQKFDFWLPSMSAVVPLGLEYSDLSGEAYIPTIGKPKGKIGIRWVGNPKFEHQQHRLFPSNLMFYTVKGRDIISLQKDVEVPEWIPQPSLENLTDTRKAISQCDLVISSCTSVAHLAAAMGIETWIVIPILPYYLWAYPGEKTPYYNSVTLFRQQEYGNWVHPFEEIKRRLHDRYDYCERQVS